MDVHLYQILQNIDKFRDEFLQARNACDQAQGNFLKLNEIFELCRKYPKKLEEQKLLGTIENWESKKKQNSLSKL